MTDLGSPWLELLSNFALAMMFVSIWAYTDQFTVRNPLARGIAFGLLQGCGAATLMFIPAELFPGVFVDLRATMIAVAGLFGGPISGLMAGALAVTVRFLVGGIGATAGILSIVLTTGVSIAGYSF